MSEEYREYRRNNRSRHQSKKTGTPVFLKKIIKQTVVSVIIFLFVFTLKTIDPQKTNKISFYIQNALTYRINMDDIKLFLDSIINLPKETSEPKEGTEVETPAPPPEETL